MSSILVVCEKPSVGASIAAVLGAKERGDGFFFGNGYIVSWAIGHLLEPAPPDAYNKKLNVKNRHNAFGSILWKTKRSGMASRT